MRRAHLLLRFRDREHAGKWRSRRKSSSIAQENFCPIDVIDVPDLAAVVSTSRGRLRTLAGCWGQSQLRHASHCGFCV